MVSLTATCPCRQHASVLAVSSMGRKTADIRLLNLAGADMGRWAIPMEFEPRRRHVGARRRLGGALRAVAVEGRPHSAHL